MDVKAVAILASLVAAMAVTATGLLQPPMYEASAQVRVSQEQGVATLIQATGSRSVAEQVIRRPGLRMEPAELLDNLTVERVGSTNFIRLTYEHTDVWGATDVVNTMAEVSSERISDTSNLTATLHEKARVPDYPTPVSPNPLRNGLLTLVAGLALSAVLIVGRSWLRLRRS